jgi:signal transduction histidine kinase
MNSLRIRLAVGFSILFTVFFAVALLIIYFSYADYRSEIFHRRLKDRAITTFRLLIHVEKIDSQLLKEIDRNTLNSLYDEKVIVLEENQVLYSSIDNIDIKYDKNFLYDLQLHKELSFLQDKNDVIGLSLPQDGKQYFVLASAYDKYGRTKVGFLRWLLSVVYFSSLTIGWIGTFIFVREAMKPLNALKKDLQNIDYTNLNSRLPERGRGEEIDELSNNINRMLERLEQSIIFQKDFIKYASHELRTPLAAMISITENALNDAIKEPDQKQVLNK